MNKKLLILSIALLIVLGLVLLVPFAVASTATGFLGTVNLVFTLVIVTTATTSLIASVILYIRLTGKRKLAGVLRIHSSLAKLPGYVLNIFGLNVDPYRSGHTSRFLSTVVGNGFNLG